MILLDWGGTAGRAPGVALVFGSGLIGGPIVRSLQRAGTASVRRMDWTWSRHGAGEAATVEAAAREALAAREGARLTIVWAAGRSGFGSEAAAMGDELASFRAVLATARRIGADLPLEQRGFVHVSSAGGLFEGQVACGRAAESAPLRPYGEGKLAQERLVRADDSLGRRHILRPSSVYGYARGARKGLIATLIAAAVRSRPATIMGALTTQRDYVYAPDIGRFIAARVLNPDPASDPADALVETSLLASGRPTAIFEIIRLIEWRFDAPLLLQIDPRPENARDNTFLLSGLPAGFRPTRLVEGVALTAAALAADRYTGAAV